MCKEATFRRLYQEWRVLDAEETDTRTVERIRVEVDLTEWNAAGEDGHYLMEVKAFDTIREEYVERRVIHEDGYIRSSNMLRRAIAEYDQMVKKYMALLEAR